MQGWIKIFRKFTDWEWFDNAEMVQLFLCLLLSANHEPKNWHGIMVGRGQVVVGRAAVCKKLKLTPQVYRTCIERLKSTSEITTESTNKYTIVTICKYDYYQQEIPDINQQNNQQPNQQVTNKQPTNNHKQELKNVRIKEDNNTPPLPPETGDGVCADKKNTTTETIIPTQNESEGGGPVDRFEDVWALYGRKGNKKTSAKKWANLKNHCREAALKHIPRYVTSTPDIQYRKNFETYLSQEAWNDEIIERPKPGAKVAHPAANYDNNKTFEQW